MTENHPITPPPELVRRWTNNAHLIQPNMGGICHQVATQAARWGADVELEACCKVLESWGSCLSPDLRAARRPKPPSLAEEGQRILVENGSTLDGRVELDPKDVSTIRAALIRLQELEQLND